MKLGELLDKKKIVKDDDIVAIGAEHGSSYIYIGRAGDRGMIEKCFERYRKKMESKLKRDEEYLRSVMSNMSKKSFDSLTDFRKVALEAEIIGKAYNAYLRTKTYVDEYQPVTERYVVDRYMKNNGAELAIIVKGYELGDFWTKEEFDKKYFKK